MPNPPANLTFGEHASFIHKNYARDDYTTMPHDSMLLSLFSIVLSPHMETIPNKEGVDGASQIWCIVVLVQCSIILFRPVRFTYAFDLHAVLFCPFPAL